MSELTPEQNMARARMFQQQSNLIEGIAVIRDQLDTQAQALLTLEDTFLQGRLVLNSLFTYGVALDPNITINLTLPTRPPAYSYEQAFLNIMISWQTEPQWKYPKLRPYKDFIVLQPFSAHNERIARGLWFCLRREPTSPFFLQDFHAAYLAGRL